MGPPHALIPVELHGASPLEKLNYLNEKGYIEHTCRMVQVYGSPTRFEARSMPSYKQYAHMTLDKGSPVSDMWRYHPYTNGVLHQSDECIDSDVSDAYGIMGRLMTAYTSPTDRVLLVFCDQPGAIDRVTRDGNPWVAIVPSISVSIEFTRILDKNANYRVDKPHIYKVFHNPTSYDEATKCREKDPHRHWCEDWTRDLISNQIGIRPILRKRRGSDGGQDAIYLFQEGGLERKVLVEIKSMDKPNINALRAVVGASRIHGADLSFLFSWSKETRQMKKERADLVSREGLETVRVITLKGFLEGNEKIEIPSSWSPLG